MPHSVLLVEDDARTRARLVRAIAAHAELSLLADVGSGAEARAVLAQSAPAVLLTDLGLPDCSGIELIHETRQAHPDTRSMVITVFGDEGHVVEAIRAGASGYLLKDASSRELGRSIIELLAGGSPISPAVARYLLRHLQAPAKDVSREASRGESRASSLLQAPIHPGRSELSRDSCDSPPAHSSDRLSEREIEVLHLVADGGSYAEIAKQLFVSVNTVGTHIKHIYDKLAVNSRGKAVRQAEQLGLLARPAPTPRSGA